MKVSIFGLGYVGCVTAGCLAKAGHEVIGVDVLPAKVEQLAAGRPTVLEKGLEELIREGVRRGLIRATTQGREAVLASDASFICVGTPSTPQGTLELTALRRTVELIGETLREKVAPHVVVLRSTVPAGTAESVVLPILHPDPLSHLLQESSLVVVPEFLREGCAIADYYDPPFLVAGTVTGRPDENAEVVNSLFRDIPKPIQWVPFRQAEMLKAVCNAFHALKVAFANEVGALCTALAIDGEELMGQFVQDHKLNLSPAYLRPGLPFGGSCLPKDLRMLVHVASRNGVDLPLLRGTLASNEAQLKRAIESVPGKGRPRIGLNGLAFKAGTDDLRESPIVLIAEHFLGKGFDVKIHDPAIESALLTGTNRDYMEEHIPHLFKRLVHSVDELLEHAEVLLIARDGEALMERLAQAGKSPTIVDLRGQSHFIKRLAEAQKRSQSQLQGQAYKFQQNGYAGRLSLKKSLDHPAAAHPLAPAPATAMP